MKALVKLVDILNALKWLAIVVIVALLWIGGCVIACGQSVPIVRVQHDSYVSYYDIEKHNPLMVCYVLEYSHFAGSYKVKGRHFKADTKLPRPRVMDKDYANSGYVRGHLVSAGDRDSDKAWLKETYLTSNLVPMSMVCNSGPWKVIEDSCRLLAMQGHRLQICRGPLYDRYRHDQDLCNTCRVRITIPAGFFSFARCLDCSLVYCSMCYNSGTTRDMNVIHFDHDLRVALLLQNIIGTWSREVYETITR